MNISDEQILNFILRVIAPSVLGAGGHYLRKKLIDKAEEVNDLFEGIGVVTAEMKEVTHETKYKRFLLFRSQNTKGGNKTTSVILEEFMRPFKSVYNDYQNLEVDSEYRDLLQRIATGQTAQVVTAELPKEAMLRRIYEAEGICGSQVFMICNTKKWVYYASMATMDASEITKSEKNKVELSKGKIKTIFEKYRKVIGD